MLATLTAQKVMEEGYDYREKLMEWYDAKPIR